MLLDLQPAARAARVCGDNLTVIRYGAGTARLRRPEVQTHLEVSLGAALAAGWRLTWQAIPRSLNGEADALAAAARSWAVELRTADRHRMQTHVDWLPEAATYRTQCCPTFPVDAAWGTRGYSAP